MFALLDNLWEEHGEVVTQFAQNVGIVPDNPNDKAILLFLSERCGKITLDKESSEGLAKVMDSVLTTGNISGNVPSALDDPDFLRSCF